MEPEKLIQLQVESHQQINLLSFRQQNGFQFTPSTKALIRTIVTKPHTLEEEQKLLQYTIRATLSSLYQVNQYYHFNAATESALLMVYKQLLNEIKNSQSEIDFDELAEAHYLRLQNWLVEHQPHVIHQYPSSEPVIKNPVVCAEYSVITQLNILGIDCQKLKEPILDIGCGREHHLVTYLHQRGLEVYGIDREAIPSDRVFRISWTDYDFKPGSWGTLISHLGFTNHFYHHHLKAGGDHLLYAKKYLQLLQSLCRNGRFYYTPGVPFIEAFLDPSHYLVMRKSVPQTRFYARTIERLW